ncbi:tetratricopeptide repeat protein [Streptomyces sp. NPDC004031]
MGRTAERVDPDAPLEMRRLAERLRSAMRAAGLESFSRLAEAADLGETVVGEALCARRAPTKRTLGRLLAACGVEDDQEWESLRFKAHAADRLRRARQREADRVAAARLSAAPGQWPRSPAAAQRRREILGGRVVLGPDGDLPLAGAVRDRDVLGIHAAPPVRGGGYHVALDPQYPSYVSRDRDRLLDEAVVAARDRGGLALVVGQSSAGKSRAMAEAMWRHLEGWRLAVPVVPGALAPLSDPAFEMHRTAVWLDDLQLHLGPGGVHVADLLRLLAHPHRPVLLATIRATELTDLTDPSGDSAPGNMDGDRRPLTRQFLARATRVNLERPFTAEELQRAHGLAGDPRIATALPTTDRYGLAEAIAAGPELRDLLAAHTADPGGHYHGAALVHAAVDCVRAGWSGPVPLDLLSRLHPLYVPDGLAGEAGEAGNTSAFDEALRWAVRLRRGYCRLLTPGGGRAVTVFDYLVDDAQYRLRPPIAAPAWGIMAEAADPRTALAMGLRAVNACHGEIAERLLSTAHAAADEAIAAEAAEQLGTLLWSRGESERAEPLLRQAAPSHYHRKWEDFLAWHGRWDELADCVTASADDEAVTRRREPYDLFSAVTHRARWRELERMLEVRSTRTDREEGALAEERRMVRWLCESDPGETLTFDWGTNLCTNEVTGSAGWWRQRLRELVPPSAWAPEPAGTGAHGGASRGGPVSRTSYAVPQDDEEWLRHAVTKWPGSATSWRNLAATLWRRNRLDEAERLLAEAADAGHEAASRTRLRILRITGRAPAGLPYASGRRISGATNTFTGGLPLQRLTGYLEMMFHELHPGLYECLDEDAALTAVAEQGTPVPLLEHYRRTRQWRALLEHTPQPNPDSDYVNSHEILHGYRVLACSELGDHAAAARQAYECFLAGRGQFGPVCAQMLLLNPDGVGEATAVLRRIAAGAPALPAFRLLTVLLDAGRTDLALGLSTATDISDFPTCGQIAAGLTGSVGLPGAAAIAEAFVKGLDLDVNMRSTQGIWLGAAAHADHAGDRDGIDDLLRRALSADDNGALHVLSGRLAGRGRLSDALDLLESGLCPSSGRGEPDTVMSEAALVRLQHRTGRTTLAQANLLHRVDYRWNSVLGHLDPRIHASAVADIEWCLANSHYTPADDS